MGGLWTKGKNTFNFGAFAGLSGWISSQVNPGAAYTASSAPTDAFYYLTSSQFARAFGKDSPTDDYSTTWETYFMENFHGAGSSGNTLVTAKLQNIADLIAHLHS